MTTSEGMKRRTRIHINVFPLLPEEVKPEEKHRDEQADGGSHPDQRCSNEVVFNLVITPTAHAKPKILERPIERCGGQDVELVWVGNQCVVRRHHGNVKVPEVAEKGRTVEFGIATRYCIRLLASDKDTIHLD